MICLTSYASADIARKSILTFIQKLRSNVLPPVSTTICSFGIETSTLVKVLTVALINAVEAIFGKNYESSICRCQALQNIRLHQ